MAIWDALGRTLGLPVTETARGLHRPDAGLPHARLRRARRDGRRGRDGSGTRYGITTFKVKVGRQPYHPGHRRGAGRSARPLGDTRSSCTSTATAAGRPSESPRAMREMADLDLTFAEELCPADDVLGRRWLVERARRPLHRRRVGAHTGRGDPRGARRLGHRRQHQDRPHRLHRSRSACITWPRALGLEVVMGNQIDGQLGIACAPSPSAPPSRSRPGAPASCRTSST